MTTSANPAPTPADSDASPSELFEIWRAIGRLEGTAAALLQGQRELKEGQQQLRADMEAGFREARTDMEAGFREARTETDARFREERTYTDAGFRELNRRIDRMFYAILGIGGALLVSVYASRFIGG